MAAGYIPVAGDIVWIGSDPRAGHEQSGRRPAVVFSPLAYNAKAGLIVYCPTPTRLERCPLEMRLSGQPARAALADQVKSLDWRVRKAAREAQATTAEMAEIRSKLRALIG